MKNIRQDAFIWAQLLLFAIIWVTLILVTTSELRITWNAVKALPEVVTIYTVLAFVFVKWTWRWGVFRGWLVPLPDLQGTWIGTISSTWVDPQTGERVQPTGATLVIRQTFSSISCVVYTPESESHSTAALLGQTEEGGIVRISYTYISRPRAGVRDRSEIHDGAAVLSYAPQPTRSLSGQYWTSRKTTGDMDFRFRDSEPVGAFVDL